MTTRELVALLMKVDPEGNTPVCVENEDIVSVHRDYAYWDGSLQQLKLENGRPVGAAIIRHGYKVKIRTLGIEDLLFDSPEAPVEMTGTAQRHEDEVERWRGQGRGFKAANPR